ncbi:T9SS type A sorting domain-containing protein [Reichenbachiella sp.]|uniref:T9SS type A sorting domain-containing protein n=1 Tax=Reichenbachiella sp. TaxID=2184521 RepID=UPI003299D5AB
MYTTVTGNDPTDATNVELQITFDEIVELGDGLITVYYNHAPNTVATTYSVSDDATANDEVTIVSTGQVSIVTFDARSLSGNRTYRVEIPAGTFDDVSDNGNDLVDGTTWTFTTPVEGVSPTLVVGINETPTDGSTPLVGTDLVLEFSEPVDYVTDVDGIQIRFTGETAATAINVNPNSGEFSSGKTIWTYTSNDMSDILSGNTTYEVYVATGAFVDASGTNNTEFVNSATWDFTTDDDTAKPLMTSFYPADDESAALPGIQTLQIYFNERVTKKAASPGDIVVSTPFETVATIDISTAAVTINNSTGTGSIIEFDVNLSGGTDYYVQIPADAFEDASVPFNSSNGIVNTTTWNFKTDLVNDVTPPNLILASVLPAHEAGASTNTINIKDNLVLVFDEPVKVGLGDISVVNALTGRTIRTAANNGSYVSGGGSTTITVDFLEDLDANADYNVFIENSSTGDDAAFTDGSGNEFAGIETAGIWDFSTEAGVTVTAANGGASIFACIGQSNTTLGTIQISESNPDDFASGGPVTYDITLTDGFYFDGTAPAPTFGTSESTADITNSSVSLAFSNDIAVDKHQTLTLTYTVGGTATTDVLEIEGLVVGINGSTEYASDIAMYRSGGNAVQYGNETYHKQVHINMQSDEVGKPSVVQSNVTICEGFFGTAGSTNLEADFDVVITPDASHTTHWYTNDDYTGEILTAFTDINDPTFAELGLDENTPGVQTLYVTQTIDANGCESLNTPVAVTIHASPNEELIAGLDIVDADDICSFEDITLGDPSNVTLIGYDFDWYGTNAYGYQTEAEAAINGAGEEGEANPFFPAPENDETNYSSRTFQYGLDVIDDKGCYAAGNATVDVFVEGRVDVSSGISIGLTTFEVTQNTGSAMSALLVDSDDHTGLFSGNGLGTPSNEDNGTPGDPSDDYRLTSFTPSSAGLVGGVSTIHTITYALTNNVTTCTDQTTIDLTVTPALNIFDEDGVDGDPDNHDTVDGSGNVLGQEYCADNANLNIILSNEGTEGAGNNFRAYDLQVLASVSGSPSTDITAGVITGQVAGYNNQTGWVLSINDVANYTNIDTEANGSIDIILVRYVAEPGGANLQALGSEIWTINPIPDFEITNTNLNLTVAATPKGLVCEEDASFNLLGSINGFPGADVTNILIEYWYGGAWQTINTYAGPGLFVGDNVTVGSILKDAYDVDTNYGLGDYRMTIESEGTDDPVFAGCTELEVIEFEILDKPNLPFLEDDGVDAVQDNIFQYIGSLDVGGTEVYTLEYASGTAIADFTILSSGGTGELFRWYNDASGLSEISDSNGDDQVLEASALFGGTNAPSGRITKNFWFSETYYYEYDDGTVFEGCESDLRQVTIEIYPIPNAPDLMLGANGFQVGTSAEYIYEYCGTGTVGVANVDIIDEMDDEAESESYYIFYADAAHPADPTDPLNDALFNTRDAAVFPLTPGIPPRTSFVPTDAYGDEGFAFVNNAGNSVTIYVRQVNFDNSEAGSIGSQQFIGTYSNPTEITINITETPADPIISDFGDIGDDDTYKFCYGSELNQLNTPNLQDIVYEWLENDMTTVIPTASSDGSRATSGELGYPVGDGSAKEINTYYVRGYIGSNEESGFIGCPSGLTEVEVTVYPQPVAPFNSIVNTGGPTGADNYVYCQEDDVALEDFEFDTYATSTDSITQFRWYTIKPDGLSLTPFLFTSNSNTPAVFADSVKFTQVESSTDLDIDVAATTTIYATQITDGTCESPSIQMNILVNAIPEVDIVDEGATTAFTTEYCNDFGTTNLQGKVDGANYNDGIGGDDVWSIDTGGLTELPSGFAQLDPNAAATAAGQPVDGLISLHEITYTYTYPATGCTNLISKSIEVNPLPELSVQYRDGAGENLATEVLDGTYICYDEDTYVIQGWKIAGNETDLTKATSGSFSIYPSNTDALNETNEISSTGFNDLSTGQATFLSADIATSIGGTRTGDTEDIFVRYEYTDGNSCVASEIAQVQIYPQPVLNVHYDSDNDINSDGYGATIHNTAVCYDDGDYVFQGTYDGNLAEDGIDPTLISMSWSISNSEGLVDETNGKATFNTQNAAEGQGSDDATDPSTNHQVTFNYTDQFGCANSRVRDIEVVKLPTLNIVVDTGDDSGSGFCTSTGTIEFQGQEDNTDVASGTWGDGSALDSFIISSTGLTDNDDGTATVIPLTAHADQGGTEVGNSATNHTVTFTYTNKTESTECTNVITTDITVNPLPELTLFSDDIIGFESYQDDVEICESQPAFTISGNRGSSNNGERSISHTYGSTTTVLETFTGSSFGDDEVLFDLKDSEEKWSDKIQSRSGVFVYEYAFSSDVTGCSNSISKEITVNVTPEIYAVVNGGCVDPQVEFEAELLNDANDFWMLVEDLEEPPRESPYTLDDFDAANGGSLQWTFYNADDNGAINENSQYDDGGGSIKYGESVSHDFDGFTGLDAQFVVRLLGTVTTASDTLTCSNAPESSEEFDITQRRILIKIDPNIAVEWDQVIEDEATSFYFNENQLSLDQIKSIEVIDQSTGISIIDEEWSTGMETLTQREVASGENVTVFGPFEYDFGNTGRYDLEVFMENANGCFDSLLRTVNIIPIEIVNPSTGYLETFDINDGFDPDEKGWYSELLVDDAIITKQLSNDGLESYRINSWIWDQINLNEDSLGLSGSVNEDILRLEEKSDDVLFGWATLSQQSGNYHYQNSEDSWLYTPAFDLSQLTKPMVRFDMIYNFENVKDGVVFQYSIDRGESWIALGSYENGGSSGLEWYNFDNVSADPGQQQYTNNEGAATSTGWSGAAVSEPTWVSARHSLNDIDIDSRDLVRFRFAIASTSDSQTEGFFGFALDNFRIEERSKNVLIEEFVSVSEEDTDGTEINTPTANLKASIADLLPPSTVNNRDETIIAYHSDFGFIDPFNAQNPAGPSSRSIYYNVDQVTSILDGQLGGTSTSAKAGELTWDEDDLRLNSLKDPGFIITLTPDPTASDTEVKGTVTFEANQDYPADTEFRAYVVILEDIVTHTVGGVDEFDNVMRKMLPSGSGKYVKLTSELTIGEPLMFADSDGNATDELSVEWDLTNIADDSNLSAIVFIQNSQTKEIYQSVKIDNANDFVSDKNSSSITDVGDDLVNATDFNMYPNPTDYEVFIIFDQLIQEDMKWTIFDQTGRVFDQGELPAGNEGFSLKTDRFPSGLYYMSIRGEKSEFEFKKLMITH